MEGKAARHKQFKRNPKRGAGKDRKEGRRDSKCTKKYETKKVSNQKAVAEEPKPVVTLKQILFKKTKSCSNLPVFRSPQGLSVAQLTPPNADQEEVKAEQGDRVAIYYVGRVVGHEEAFDMQARGRPLRFALGGGEVIHGLEIGICGMAVGEMRKIIIPPTLGYGENEEACGKIPPHSTLEFEVKLLKIRRRESDDSSD